MDEEKKDKIEVQVVDNDPGVTKGYEEIINRSSAAVTTGVYSSITSFRRGLLQSQPAVVLLDNRFSKSGSDKSGIDFCQELRKHYPSLKIIILTFSESYSDIRRALANGAHGYIVKGAPEEEIIACIEYVNAGNQFLCAEAESLKNKHEGRINNTPTDDELELLKLIAEGYTEAEIGKKIDRALPTVKWRINNLRMKLDAINLPNLIAIAFRNGYVT